MYQEEQLISIQRYATKHKLSAFNVIKQINTGKLKTIKKDDEEFIIDETILPPMPVQTISPMRRKEFAIDNQNDMITLLQACEYGTLSLVDNKGTPYGVPLNFAWWEEGIVFHGAIEGKKIEILAQNPKASFNVVKSYAFIPSHFSGTTSACPATQFFASVSLGGNVKEIKNADEKALALNALMEKLQPEKKYETITANNPIYTKMLEKTAVFKLTPTWHSMKLKLGQQLPKERQNMLIQQLRERGLPLDILTANLMENNN